MIDQLIIGTTIGSVDFMNAFYTNQIARIIITLGNFMCCVWNKIFC